MVASHYWLDTRRKNTKTYKGIGEKSGLSHCLEETHELEDMKASTLPHKKNSYITSTCFITFLNLYSSLAHVILHEYKALYYSGEGEETTWRTISITEEWKEQFHPFTFSNCEYLQTNMTIKSENNYFIEYFRFQRPNTIPSVITISRMLFILFLQY